MAMFEPLAITAMPEEVYRNPCPLDRALLVLYEGRVLILEHIGPGLHYLVETMLMDESFEDLAKGMSNGVYLWEGRLIRDPSDDRCDSNPYLDGVFRLATKKEWTLHITGDELWDRTLWFEPVQEGPCPTSL